jgi:hypothetical protein
MGLDIGAYPPGSAKAPPVCSVMLDDDGYYWFLHPLFEAAGLHIDLYGDATFGTSHFGRLKKLLHGASELVEARPAKWQVKVGTILVPEKKDAFALVTKVEFRELLAKLRRVVEEAERLGGYVECQGD